MKFVNFLKTTYLLILSTVLFACEQNIAAEQITNFNLTSK